MTINNRISILTVLSTSLIILSCNKLLDTEQNTKITSLTAWNSESSAKSNVGGIYALMRSAFNQGFAYWGEYRNGLWGGGRRNGDHEPLSSVMRSTLNSSNSMTDWSGIYTTINQANLAIKHLPEVNFKNENEKNESIASAYFARAFCYYWIVRIWGDAPLELEPYESFSMGELSSRVPASTIYDQIENDLTMARKLIPKTAADKIRASYAGIEMLAGDYFLWRYKVVDHDNNNLKKADTAIQNVLTAPGYELEDNYSAIFANENGGREVIFKWPYTQAEYENGYPYNYLYATTNLSNPQWIDDSVPVSPNPQWVNITLDYAGFLFSDSSDTRAAISYGQFNDFGWVNKFPGHLISGERVYDSDIDVYRYADAILFDAEIKLAKADIDGAKQALNQIAERAYKTSGYYDDLSAETEILEAIIKERKKEFVAEGRLWWDFIRLGVAFKESPYLVGRENEKNILLWPVNSKSLNSNSNIKQTEGY